MATPPDAYGYPNGSITADKLPIWQQPLSRYSVGGVTDWKVTSLASIDRGIKVEKGTGSGDGVTDVTYEYETMSLPSPPIASAWYLIVRRRNWTAPGTSTLVAIRGTAEKKLPARENVPGAKSDQPLALVRVTQKDSTVQEIVNLSCWASNGGVEAADKLALEYLDVPGAAVKLGRSVWRYEAKGNGVWGWREYPEVSFTVEGATPGSGRVSKVGTVTVSTDANGAAAWRFDESFPTRLFGVVITQAMSPNLGLVHCRFDEALSDRSRFAVFAYDAQGARLRNTIGIRVSFVAYGD